MASLAKYLAKGGHFIAFIDPYGSPSLVKFLQAYGMTFVDQVIVDPAYRLSAGEILTTQIPLYSKDNPMTRAMAAPAVLSMARGIEVTGKPGDKAPDGLVINSTSDFLRSSHESWASGDPKAVTTGITDFQSAATGAVFPVRINDYFTLHARVAYRITDDVTVALAGEQMGRSQLLEAAGPPVERRIMASVSGHF